MGVRFFEDWVEAEGLAKVGTLQCLKGATIGIDAAFFARQFIAEPLLTALGGSPIALEGVQNALQNLLDADISLHFVFNGLHSVKVEDPFAKAEAVNVDNRAAFAQYESQRPTEARRAFSALGPVSLQLDEHMATLKRVLYQRGIPFTVAPYSALAQLAYYEHHPSQFVDAVYGPSELFCFGAEKVITQFAGLPVGETDQKFSMTDVSAPADKLQFSWIDSSSCLKALGNVHTQVFLDSLILSGSDHLLETFPPLLMSKPATVIREAVGMLVQNRGNVSRLCSQYPDPSPKEAWLDKYKQVIATIKHHVVITVDGDVESIDKETSPSDIHLCIGLRLPEELFAYLSSGLIGTRVLNWLTRGEIQVLTPLAGADADVCRQFSRSYMNSLRQQAVCLPTEHLHRYYQRTELKTTFWFDRGIEDKVKPIDLNPSPKSLVSKWHVRKALIDEAPTSKSKPGDLLFAVQSLYDVKYAEKTSEGKSKHDKPLSHRDEILANTIWRMLQLRSFIDESHKLTTWGKILETSLAAVRDNNGLSEAVFLAIEMLRLGLLNAHTMFPGYPGTPMRGSQTDRGSCMLVARVASFGRLRHKPKGYSGPLSRSLLAYHSFISSLQGGVRDLLEMNLVSMFLDGSVERNRDDWMELSLGLPFSDVASCSLGIAILNYLDNLDIHGDSTDEKSRERTRAEAQNWIQHSEFEPSLKDAFHLWDAVYKGVKEAGSLVQDVKLWDDTDKWLSLRR